MSKTITDLLDAVTKAKAALDKAQTDYDTAKSELASSPLLAEAGLQVIGGEKESGLTTEAAILKALGGGKEMSVTEIMNKASQLKGVSIPRHNIAFHLAKLKKEKTVTNPKHAHYKMAK